MRTIRVESGSELARLLDEVADEPVLLERNGRRYKVSPEPAILTRREDLHKSWDPEAALAGMHAAAGRWSHLDADELKRRIYRWREEGNRPADRP
jgi:hypothetical protein